MYALFMTGRNCTSHRFAIDGKPTHFVDRQTADAEIDAISLATADRFCLTSGITPQAAIRDILDQRRQYHTR
jgi:hypothetical protein